MQPGVRARNPNRIGSGSSSGTTSTVCWSGPSACSPAGACTVTVTGVPSADEEARHRRRHGVRVDRPPFGDEPDLEAQVPTRWHLGGRPSHQQPLRRPGDVRDRGSRPSDSVRYPRPVPAEHRNVKVIGEHRSLIDVQGRPNPRRPVRRSFVQVVPLLLQLAFAHVATGSVVEGQPCAAQVQGDAAESRRVLDRAVARWRPRLGPARRRRTATDRPAGVQQELADQGRGVRDPASDVRAGSVTRKPTAIDASKAVRAALGGQPSAHDEPSGRRCPPRSASRTGRRPPGATTPSVGHRRRPPDRPDGSSRRSPPLARALGGGMNQRTGSALRITGIAGPVVSVSGPKFVDQVVDQVADVRRRDWSACRPAGSAAGHAA